MKGYYTANGFYGLVDGSPIIMILWRRVMLPDQFLKASIFFSGFFRKLEFNYKW